MIEEYKDIFEAEDGFYFWDEAGFENGPYSTQEQAQIALDAYVKWMNHDHQEYGIRKMRGHYD